MSNCPGRKSDFVLYRYDPSLAAAVIFLVLFKLSTILHAVQAVRTRSWYLTPFIIGGICELYPTPLLRHALTYHSRSAGLRWPHMVFQRPVHHRPIHHANTTSSPRSCPLCRIHLHDPRAHYPPYRWRKAFHRATHLAHQDIRWR